jgi:Zn-dependent M28 family amino/carboxypeptidase
MMPIATLLALAALLLPASRPAPPRPAGDAFSRAVAGLSASRISARIRFLSDDLLEGRGTGARGSEIAARYIASEFEEDHLTPAGDSGSFLQSFDLVGVSADPASVFELATPQGVIALRNADNAVVSSRAQQENVAIDSPIVWVGYGITAPEMHWDDYAGVDVADKVVICLVNDPPSEDPAFFGGRALTYYGRWTYKYEEAARHHAAGVLLVHTDESAGYGWHVVRNSWSSEQAQLGLEPGEKDLAVRGWLTKETAERFFSDNGLSLATETAAAGRRGFRARQLESRARGQLKFRIRRYRTENVAGILEGSDPSRKGTVIALTAHFDHLGIGAPDARGDTIYNGALDNASGTAELLEIARAAADAGWKPERSILFLAVTAEEQGLLGSAWAARHPPSLGRPIVASFNVDETPVFGRMEDYTMLGIERTTLSPLAESVARRMGIKLSPESHPEQGSYFRSDHFPFARSGVPAISIEPGSIVAGHDAAYGEKLFNDFNDNRYHQPSDEFDPGWNLAGTVQEARLVLELMREVSRARETPRMAPGQSFGPAKH